MGRARAAASAFALVVLTGLVAAPEDSAAESCTPESGGRHEVVRVLDSETLLLDDGQEVRLMGALAPQPDAARTKPDDASPAGEASKVLEALVSGRTITLRYEGRRRDRYGRILAQVDVEGPDGRLDWLQQRLVASGHARAYALPGNGGCLLELMTAEDEARRARRGLWSRELFRVRAASEEAALLRLADRFVIVEGRVAKVARTRRTTFINFGADWRRDFTASIATAAVDRTDDGAARAGALEGKEVRVRGWIERRNGPMIVLGSLDEIEVLDEAGRCSPPPCGEGLGVGEIPTADGQQSPPPSLPRKGGGTGQ